MKIRNLAKKGLAVLALAGAIAVGYNPKPYNPNKYAVLVCGRNEERFVNMLGRTYNALRGVGFKKENISVLDQAGKEYYHGQYLSEGERKYPCNGIASKNNVKDLFSELEKKVDDDDTLLIHFTDHGDRITIFQDGKPTEASTIVLQDDMLDEEELYSCLSKLNPGLGVVTTDTCFGGGIAKRVGRGNFIGISSSEEDFPSFSFADRFFMDEFYQSFSDRTISDINGDGKISVGESFNYARKHCFWAADASSKTFNFPFIFFPPVITPQIFSDKNVYSVTLE